MAIGNFLLRPPLPSDYVMFQWYGPPSRGMHCKTAESWLIVKRRSSRATGFSSSLHLAGRGRTCAPADFISAMPALCRFQPVKHIGNIAQRQMFRERPENAADRFAAALGNVL